MQLHKLKDAYWKACSFMEFLVETVIFDQIILFFILVAAVLVGIESYDSFQNNPAVMILDSFVLGVFALEVAAKIMAEKDRPWRYFNGPNRSWNTFDFLIVVFCMPFIPVNSGSIAFLRMMRLFRVAKLFEHMPELNVILTGMMYGLESILYIIILLFLLFYLFAIIAVFLFRENDPANFGDLSMTIVSLFRCATLEDWTDLMYINMFGCDVYDAGLYYPSNSTHVFPTRIGSYYDFTCVSPKAQGATATVFFTVFTIISAFVVLSLFIGAITLAMSEVLDESYRERKRAKIAQVVSPQWLWETVGKALDDKRIENSDFKEFSNSEGNLSRGSSSNSLEGNFLRRNAACFPRNGNRSRGHTSRSSQRSSLDTNEPRSRIMYSHSSSLGNRSSQEKIANRSILKVRSSEQSPIRTRLSQDYSFKRDVRNSQENNPIRVSCEPSPKNILKVGPSEPSPIMTGSNRDFLLKGGDGNFHGSTGNSQENSPVRVSRQASSKSILKKGSSRTLSGRTESANSLENPSSSNISHNPPQPESSKDPTNLSEGSSASIRRESATIIKEARQNSPLKSSGVPSPSQDHSVPNSSLTPEKQDFPEKPSLLKSDSSDAKHEPTEKILRSSTSKEHESSGQSTPVRSDNAHSTDSEHEASRLCRSKPLPLIIRIDSLDGISSEEDKQTPKQKQISLAKKPDLTKGSSFRKPNLDKQESFKKPCVNKQQSFKKPNLDKQESFKKPGVNKQKSFKQPNLDKQQSFKKPGFNKQQSFKKPNLDKQQSFKKPGFNKQQSFRRPEFMKQHSRKKLERGISLTDLRLQKTQSQRQLIKRTSDQNLLRAASMKPQNMKEKVWVIYLRWSLTCRRIAHSPKFETFMMVTICAAGLLAGISTVVPENQAVTDSDNVILGIFTAEAVIKFFSSGRKPWRYFLDPWNRFDSIIVFCSYVPLVFNDVTSMGSVLTSFRLMRVLRVLKLVQAFRQLKIVMEALFKGFQSMIYISMMMCVLFYMFAIVGMILFKENDPWHFGLLQDAMLTLFRCATLEDWTDIMYTNMWGCDRFGYDNWPELCTSPVPWGWLAALYFVVFAVVGSLVLVTLFLGVVSTGMESAALRYKMEDDMQAEINAALKIHRITDHGVRLLYNAYSLLDEDDSGKLTYNEMRPLLKVISPDFTELNLRDAYDRVDENKNGEIDFAEFMHMMILIKDWAVQKANEEKQRSSTGSRRKSSTGSSGSSSSCKSPFLSPMKTTFLRSPFNPYHAEHRRNAVATMGGEAVVQQLRDERERPRNRTESDLRAKLLKKSHTQPNLRDRMKSRAQASANKPRKLLRKAQSERDLRSKLESAQTAHPNTAPSTPQKLVRKAHSERDLRRRLQRARTESNLTSIRENRSDEFGTKTKKFQMNRTLTPKLWLRNQEEKRPEDAHETKTNRDLVKILWLPKPLEPNSLPTLSQLPVQANGRSKPATNGSAGHPWRKVEKGFGLFKAKTKQTMLVIHPLKAPIKSPSQVSLMDACDFDSGASSSSPVSVQFGMKDRKRQPLPFLDHSAQRELSRISESRISELTVSHRQGSVSSESRSRTSKGRPRSANSLPIQQRRRRPQSADAMPLDASHAQMRMALARKMAPVEKPPRNQRAPQSLHRNPRERQKALNHSLVESHLQHRVGSPPETEARRGSLNNQSMTVESLSDKHKEVEGESSISRSFQSSIRSWGKGGDRLKGCAPPLKEESKERVRRRASDCLRRASTGLMTGKAWKEEALRLDDIRKKFHPQHEKQSRRNLPRRRITQKIGKYHSSGHGNSPKALKPPHLKEEVTYYTQPSPSTTDVDSDGSSFPTTDEEMPNVNRRLGFSATGRIIPLEELAEVQKMRHGLLKQIEAVKDMMENLKQDNMQLKSQVELNLMERSEDEADPHAANEQREKTKEVSKARRKHGSATRKRIEEYTKQLPAPVSINFPEDKKDDESDLALRGIVRQTTAVLKIEGQDGSESSNNEMSQVTERVRKTIPDVAGQRSWSELAQKGDSDGSVQKCQNVFRGYISSDCEEKDLDELVLKSREISALSFADRIREDSIDQIPAMALKRTDSANASGVLGNRPKGLPRRMIMSFPKEIGRNESNQSDISIISLSTAAEMQSTPGMKSKKPPLPKIKSTQRKRQGNLESYVSII